MNDELETCSLCNRKRKIAKGFNVCGWCWEYFNIPKRKKEKLTEEEKRMISIRLFFWILIVSLLGFATAIGHWPSVVILATLAVCYESSWKKKEE